LPWSPARSLTRRFRKSLDSTEALAGRRPPLTRPDGPASPTRGEAVNQAALQLEPTAKKIPWLLEDGLLLGCGDSSPLCRRRDSESGDESPHSQKGIQPFWTNTAPRKMCSLLGDGLLLECGDLALYNACRCGRRSAAVCER
jgi:hypothetical protein